MQGENYKTRLRPFGLLRPKSKEACRLLVCTRLLGARRRDVNHYNNNCPHFSVHSQSTLCLDKRAGQAVVFFLKKQMRARQREIQAMTKLSSQSPGVRREHTTGSAGADCTSLCKDPTYGFKSCPLRKLLTVPNMLRRSQKPQLFP